MTAWTRREVLLVAGVLALAWWLVWPDLFRGWIPWDDGGMAMIADRVLRGDMPHRDFDDPWTGGWSYFQAEVFRQFGASLAMLRVPIFLGWLAGLVCTTRIARRFLDPDYSALVAVACAVWSLFAWHLPLPNWFYAPLSLAAVWAVIRFEERPRRRWLVAAGLCVGVSLLVKVTGLFLLAGVSIWCVARAVDISATSPADVPGARAPGLPLIAATLMAVFVAAVVLLLRALPPDLHAVASVHFLLPSVTLAAWVVFRAWRDGRPGVAVGRELVRLLVPFAVGIMLALVPFVWSYWRVDAVHDLLLGVFVRPRVRLDMMTFGPPGRGFTMLGGLPVAVFFFGSVLAKPALPERTRWLAAALGASWGALSLVDGGALREGLVLSVRTVPVLLPLFAAWCDWRSPMTGARGRMIVLLVAVATTAQLLQVPFAFLSYFLFASMLSLLAAAAVMAVAVPEHRPILVFWSCFLLVAGGVPSGLLRDAGPQWHALPLARAGIQVSYLDSVRWGRLDAFMRQRPPGAILVLGDAPEVPFLLGRSSVSRVVYDVLSDSATRDASFVLGVLRQGGAHTVIIRHRNDAWAAPSLTAAPALRREFPDSRRLGPYEVRWSAARDVARAKPAPVPSR